MKKNRVELQKLLSELSASCQHTPSPHPEVETFLASATKGVSRQQIAAIHAAQAGDSTALDRVRHGRNTVCDLSDSTLQIEEFTVAGIPLRTYRKKGSNSGKDPVVLYLHGGGWTIGGINSCSRFCRDLALASSAEVIAPDYALAPEHPYPAALDDVLKLREWLASERSTCQLFLGGDSSGGNLAIASALRDPRKGCFPVGLILFFPVTTAWADHTLSWQQYGDGYALDSDLMETFNKAYAPEGKCRQDEFISPILSKNLGTLPPMLLITAQCDILHDQGQTFARQVRNAGVPVLSNCYAGASHLFISMPGMDVFFNRAVKDAVLFMNCLQDGETI